jgi:hypothetical protein
MRPRVPRVLALFLAVVAACAPAGGRLCAQGPALFQPTPLGWTAGPLVLRGPARRGGFIGVEGRRAAA